MRLLLTSIGIICVAGLIGCSGEPSASDIKHAVQDSFTNDTSILSNQNIFGALASAAGLQNVKLDSAEKVGCQPDGDNAYRCEVVIEYTFDTEKDSLASLMGVGGPKRSVAKYRFIKTSKGWITDSGVN